MHKCETIYETFELLWNLKTLVLLSALLGIFQAAGYRQRGHVSLFLMSLVTALPSYFYKSNVYGNRQFALQF